MYSIFMVDAYGHLTLVEPLSVPQLFACCLLKGSRPIYLVLIALIADTSDTGSECHAIPDSHCCHSRIVILFIPPSEFPCMLKNPPVRGSIFLHDIQSG